MDTRKVSRALLSVSDKTGLVDFAKALAMRGVVLVSTGGTAKALRNEGLNVVDVSEVTGNPEMMGGRVKTLHPKIHGGLLAVRGNAEHEAAMTEHAIPAIDLLVVNLYPFEATVRAGGDFDVCMLQREMGEIDPEGCNTIYPPPGYLHEDDPDPGVLREAEPLKLK